MRRILSVIIMVFSAFFFPLFAQEDILIDAPGIREELMSKNEDIELLTPKYGERFELGEDILVTWRNKNSEKEYVYVPYFYYVVGDFQMSVSHRGIEEMVHTLKPFQKSIIVFQLYYYDSDRYMTEEIAEYTYVSDILVLGIGMDVDEYWLKRYEKGRKENPTPPQPITPEDPPLVPPSTKPNPAPSPTPTPPTEVENKKPFVFPFAKPVGVSQWHGYTAFQKPHTGIDFSVARENTLAIGDGRVMAKGYDTYYGPCNSGGNFLTIKHDNGMYSVYFHLEETYTDVGKRVSKGEIVAKTGNSGSWNCKPLAYHLHFELRKERSQSTHVNPVEYIEQDWNLIPTANYKQYPGRLSGDNPHPGS